MQIYYTQMYNYALINTYNETYLRPEEDYYDVINNFLFI